jgi:hypothetical protein
VKGSCVLGLVFGYQSKLMKRNLEIWSADDAGPRRRFISLANCCVVVIMVVRKQDS